MLTVTLLASPLRVNVLLATMAGVVGLPELGAILRTARSPGPAPMLTALLRVRVEVPAPPPPARAPPLLTLTVPLTVPEPPKVPPLLTVTADPLSPPLTFSRPALMVVGPV